MKCEFVPVDYDYFDFEGKNYVKMIGRNEKGKKICVVDTYEPNFWVILHKEHAKTASKVAAKIKKISVDKAGRQTKVTRIDICEKHFLGKAVTALRVYVTNHKDAHDVASEIGDLKEIDKRREYDINIITKYIKERGVEPLRWYTMTGDLLTKEDLGGIIDSLELDTFILAKTFEKIEGKEFTPKILTYDIECEGINPNKGDLYSIGVYGKDTQKVFTWKKVKNPSKYVEILKGETETVEAFSEFVNKVDPDILAGYFSDGFDMPFLKGTMQLAKAKFELGLDRKGPQFRRGRIPSAKIAGIVHVDLFRFVDAVFSQYLQSETLGLGDVAAELVGETKKDFDFARYSHMKEKDWKELFSYNLQDVKVTYLLAEKLWPDMKEFVNITKEPLFEVTRSRMAAHVENYVLHNLDEYEEIAEKRPVAEEIGKRRNFGAFEGAFVFQPEPGLYEDIVMFDFTSMYPSVIISYNLSKSTHIKEEKFSKEEGFFPSMLRDIIERRKKYKKEYASKKSGMAKARSNAYKLLANAAYGYQAFFGARYYCREAAASTARLARDNIKKTIKNIEKAGHKIIYSDTDSIAFSQGKKTDKQILEFLEKLNNGLPGIMELDLEDFYKRGLFVTGRNSEKGAKKKYALIDKKNKMKVRGFETVRRDWCGLSRKLQSEVLLKLLKEGNEKSSIVLLKKTVKDLKERKVPLEKLMMKTKLKRPLDAYTAIGPHVAAAQKMKAQGLNVGVGTIIQYYIGETNGKGKLIRDKVFLADEKANYDIEYYLNNQVLPVVENIFEVFNVNVKEIVDGHKQKTLF